MLYESNTKPPGIENRTTPQALQQASQAAKAPTCNCNKSNAQTPVPNNVNTKKLSRLSSVPPRQAPARQLQDRTIGLVHQQPPARKPVKGWEEFRQSTVQPASPDKAKYIFVTKEPADAGMMKSAGQQASTATGFMQDVCPNCGRTYSYCDTLSGFVFDGAELNITHKGQIKALARRIIDLGIKTVTATGYTDTSGSGAYNTGLGYRRAQQVISAIMSRMHKMKPYAAQNVFWKTKTKGASRPVSLSDAALNRRVEVCLR